MNNSLDIFDCAHSSFVSFTSQNNLRSSDTIIFKNIAEVLFSKWSVHWGLDTTKQSGVLTISNFRALADDKRTSL